MSLFEKITLSILFVACSITTIECKEIPRGIFSHVGGTETLFLIEDLISTDEGIQLQVEQWCEVNNDFGYNSWTETNRIARIKFIIYRLDYTRDPDSYYWRLVWTFNIDKSLQDEVVNWTVGDTIKMDFDFRNMTLKNNRIVHEISGLDVPVVPISIAIVPERDCRGGGIWSLR